MDDLRKKFRRGHLPKEPAPVTPKAAKKPPPPAKKGVSRKGMGGKRGRPPKAPGVFSIKEAKFIEAMTTLDEKGEYPPQDKAYVLAGLGKPGANSTKQISLLMDGKKKDYRVRNEIDRIKRETVQKLLTRHSRDKETLLDRIWAVAMVDPNEIIQVRRTCCRYCWGIDHKQEYTPRELEEAKRLNESTNETRAKKMLPPLWFEHGGATWNPNRDPNPKCPECFGRGVEQVSLQDTTKMSPAALALYAGAKQTRDGVQILMHDQMVARTTMAKHMGLLVDRVQMIPDRTMIELILRIVAEHTTAEIYKEIITRIDLELESVDIEDSGSAKSLTSGALDAEFSEESDEIGSP